MVIDVTNDVLFLTTKLEEGKNSMPVFNDLPAIKEIAEEIFEYCVRFKPLSLRGWENMYSMNIKMSMLDEYGSLSEHITGDNEEKFEVLVYDYLDTVFDLFMKTIVENWHCYNDTGLYVFFKDGKYYLQLEISKDENMCICFTPEQTYDKNAVQFRYNFENEYTLFKTIINDALLSEFKIFIESLSTILCGKRFILRCDKIIATDESVIDYKYFIFKKEEIENPFHFYSNIYKEKSEELLQFANILDKNKILNFNGWMTINCLNFKYTKYTMVVK